MCEKNKKEFAKGKQNYQDSVFCMLFGEKESAVELYNALEGTSYGPDVDFEFTTLDDAVYADIRNDLGFKIAGKYVVLTEHQSTINQNMAIRHLQYLGRTYEKELDQSKLYQKGKMIIPTPEFYVLYTGSEEWDEAYLHLSDSFACEPPENSAELVVKIIDVRYNKDEYNEVLARSEKLRGYSILISYVKKYQKETKDKSLAIRLAVQRCLEEGILKDFLMKNSAEVGRMMFRTITMEEIAEVRAAEMAEERAQKLAEERAHELADERAQELVEETKEELCKKFIVFRKEQGTAEALIKQELIAIYGLDDEKAEFCINQIYRGE